MCRVSGLSPFQRFSACVLGFRINALGVHVFKGTGLRAESCGLRVGVVGRGLMLTQCFAIWVCC